MEDSGPIENDFLKKLSEIIEANLSNENFGVSELASEVGMSRSNLLRKVNKLTKLSASQYIRQVRLKTAMGMLRQTSLNISEVSYKVGFGSTSYFIKCFREYYGYPPGEVGKRQPSESTPIPMESPHRKRSMLLAGIGILTAIVLFAVWWPTPTPTAALEKSIVVLPFKNDSNDSTNVYLINGLMESTLNNLQKIKDLRVLSRTSAEKYRNTTKSIPEMARELNVSYFVEGSGQKIGDRILLNIQLIEASGDRHLWAKQYERKTDDIFLLQQEVSKSIAEEISAIITPEEQKRIDKVPTQNLVAYDYYLKGLDLLKKGGNQNMLMAVTEFEQAIAHDSGFALAHAYLAFTFYYLDIWQEEKMYTERFNSHADKAMLLDAKLPESLMAKAYYYMHKKEYALAEPYMEKALEFYPNSAEIINSLSDFYATYQPNTAKYLEYALRGVKLDIAAHDSVMASYIYLHLSNALIQTGFTEEALMYIDKSLDYNPNNYYSNYVKAFILYAKNRNLEETKTLLMKELEKDTSRLDLTQELGKVCFYMGDMEGAYAYYKKFIDSRESRQLDIYQHENLRISVVFSQMGLQEKANELLRDYKAVADQDQSIYQPLLLSGYYMEIGDTEKALDMVRLFSKEDHYHYWIVLFLEHDPLMDKPGCKELVAAIKEKFWKNHAELRVRLEEEGLI